MRWVCVRVCRPLCVCLLLLNGFEWVEVMIPPDGKLSIGTCWCVGVCYLWAQIPDAPPAFCILNSLVDLSGPKTTSYEELQKRLFCSLHGLLLKDFTEQWVNISPVKLSPLLRGNAAVLHIWRNMRFWAQSGTLCTQFSLTGPAFTARKLRLTVAPHVALVGVSSVQDRFQCHPLYWYLKDKTKIQKSLNMLIIYSVWNVFLSIFYSFTTTFQCFMLFIRWVLLASL